MEKSLFVGPQWNLQYVPYVPMEQNHRASESNIKRDKTITTQTQNIIAQNVGG